MSPIACTPRIDRPEAPRPPDPRPLTERNSVRSIFRATTRSMMLPTVAQAMCSRFFTAVLFISRATQATRSSKSRVNRDSCSAQGIVSVTTPCSGQSSRQSTARRTIRHLPSETCRHSRVVWSYLARVENVQRGQRWRRCRFATSTMIPAGTKATPRTNAPCRASSLLNTVVTRTGSSVPSGPRKPRSTTGFRCASFFLSRNRSRSLLHDTCGPLPIRRGGEPELAAQAGADEGGESLIVEFVLRADQEGEADEDARDAVLRDRLSRLEAFIELATSLANDLRAQVGADKVEKG